METPEADDGNRVYLSIVRGIGFFLVAVAFVGLPAGFAWAAGSHHSPPPHHTVEVLRDEESHKLTCVVREAQAATKMRAMYVHLTVPAGFVLESASVNTASGRSEVTSSATASWTGPYTLTIGAAKVDGAASGNLILVIHSDFTKETVTCPALPLFQPKASPS